MRRLFRRPSRETGSQAIDEAPLDWTFEQGQAAFQRRPQFARILKLFFLFLKLFFFLVMICLPYLWWINLFTTNPKLQLQSPTESLIFPLHARFSFDTSVVDNASQPHSPSLQLLGLQDLDQLETYYTRVRPLHNIAFFAEMYVGGKTYFMLIDTGSEVSWIFCEPPFIITKDNLKVVGPRGYYEPNFDNLILYKDLSPPGFYVCYDGGFLCKDIYYVGGLVVNVLMVQETFVMQHIDMSTTSKKLVFGCGHSFKGPIDFIEDGVDGVLGLMPNLFSIPYQLASIHAISKIIGLCLERHIQDHLQDVVGYLFFGDEVSLVQEQMTWIKMINDATPFGFAAAFLKSIQIGRFNNQVGEQNAKMVFDTGTTMTYLMPVIYDALIQYVKQNYSCLWATRLRNVLSKMGISDFLKI